MNKSLCVAALMLTAATSLFAADWPNYRGPNTDGIVAVNVPDKLTLTPVWKIAPGDAYGQVTVQGDKALIFAKGQESEVLLCLNARTGKELWRAKIDKSVRTDHGDGPRTTPAVSDNRIYVCSTHNKLVCVYIVTGEKIWEHDVLKEFDAREIQYGNAASPVVVEDVVVVTGGGAGHGILGFNKNSGQLAWAKTDAKGTHATPTVATIHGMRQVICFMKSGLVAVNPRSGEILWAFDFPTRNAVAASPVVGGKNGDIVYLSSGYNIGAAACRISKDGDTWKATQLWRTDHKNPNHWSTPVYHDGFIYGLYGQNKDAVSNQGDLSCIDIETGNVKWTEKGIGSQGGLIVLGDKLLIQTPMGDLLLAAASPSGYKELGRATALPGKNWTAPAFANGMLFVRNFSEAACLKIESAP